MSDVYDIIKAATTFLVLFMAATYLILTFASADSYILSVFIAVPVFWIIGLIAFTSAL